MAAMVDERTAQKSYWMEHSSEPTVEAMMLDSKAAEIDQLERPEVGCGVLVSLLTPRHCSVLYAHALQSRLRVGSWSFAAAW